MKRNPLILRLFTLARPVVLGLVALLALPTAGESHEIPKSVTIIAFLKPEPGGVLRIVARIPLEAMRDVQWPMYGPGYLVLPKLDEFLRDGTKIWVIDNLKLYEDGAALPAPVIAHARVSLQSDRSFESYPKAVAHFADPALPDSMQLAWQQAMVDVVLEYKIRSHESRFSIDPQLARLGVRTTTVLRFVPMEGDERAFTYVGDPGLVHLDPNVLQAAWQFIKLGFGHILDGIDHLLFVICLVIPFRRLRPLLVIVTAFTIAHSMTMVASALGFAPAALWFPPVVEVLIALSIVYTAFENIVGAKVERRWIIAFFFGLIHGFGFSFALRESLQFAGTHLATSLATFNIGVELGQILVLLVTVPVLNWLFRRVVAERMGTIILSAIVAHTAWHWMLDRGTTLGEYSFSIGPAEGAELLRVAFLAVLGAAIVWLLRPLARRLLGTGPGEPAPLSSSSPAPDSVHSL